MPPLVTFDGDSCEKAHSYLAVLGELAETEVHEHAFQYVLGFILAAKEVIRTRVTLFEGHREHYVVIAEDGDVIADGKELQETLQIRPKFIGATIHRKSSTKSGPPEYRWDGNSWVYAPGII